MASSLQLRVLSAQDLKIDEVLAPTCLLINQSYNERESEGLLDRYSSPAEFLNDLGTDGLCAIIIDSGKGNVPVAVAVAKRWKERQKDSATASSSNDDDVQDWEIGPAASYNRPEYRRKGLMDRCLQSLEARLLSQSQKGSVRLWVKTVEDMYAGYWGRKGFEQCGASYVIPVGEWHRDRSYTLVDMVKEISTIRVALSTKNQPPEPGGGDRT